MPSLLPVLFYPDFFAQDFTLDAVREAPGETDRLILSLSGDPVTILPSPVAASVPPTLSGQTKTDGAFHPGLQRYIKILLSEL